MSLVSVSGGGLLYPRPDRWQAPPTLATAALIDATGEKMAWCGPVWFPGRTGSKNISRAQFRFATVTKAGGSALTVSLQDVSLTSGPPIQPDGTQDQTVAIANADASFASNTWYRTGTFSATRPVSYGDLVSVVVEFDGSGRLGADAVNFSGLTAGTTADYWGNSVSTAFTSSAWGAISLLPCILLEFDDGTYGTINGALPVSATNTHTFNVNTGTADEFAAVINVPWPCKVDGLWACVTLGGDCELILYSGTTAQATVTLDANATASASARLYMAPISEITLAANTDYYVAVRPTTTTNISAYSFDVNDANHWTVHDGGTAIQYVTRLNQGSWAAKTATRRLVAGVRISALDDGVQVGGLLTHPGMTGGMRG